MEILCVLLVLSLLLHHAAAQGGPSAGAPDDATRILFIGNSYTGGWADEAGARAGGVPGMLQSLARARHKPVMTDASLRGGTALHEHLADGTRIADALKQTSWDCVVLQEYSTLPTRKGDGTHGTTDDFLTAVGRFGKLIREQHPDARIVLFQSWAREKDDPIYPRYLRDPAQMNADLRRNYDKAAVMIGAEVAPVGTAWALALKARPDLQLHCEDRHHARVAGSYLAALVFYITIFHDDPRGLPPLPGVSSEEASFLQEIAWEAGTSEDSEASGASGGSVGDG